MSTTDIEVDLHTENPDEIYRSYFTKNEALASATYPIKYMDDIPYSFNEWFSSGVCAAKESYVNGKKHGLFYRFYPSGTLSLVEHYKDGKRHGLSIWFSYLGRTTQKKYYVDGQLVRNII
jgi:antitoxin component YwqK of YwqJK toxin-antitoxin module